MPGSFIRISDPFLKTFLSIGPVSSDRSYREAFVSAENIFGELFYLAVVKRPPAAVLREVAALEAILPKGMDAARALDSIARGDAHCDIIETLGRFVGPDQEALLGRRVTSDAAIADTLASACDDVWAPALLELRRWRDGDRGGSPFPREIDETFDCLDQSGGAAKPTPFAFRCVKAARERVEPCRDLCVLTTVRNEGLYLVDWLAYHRALGVEEFFVYTNDNDDYSDALLKALNDADIIKLVFNEFDDGVRPQYKAYAHALQIMPEILDYRWVAAIDLDEYIVCNNKKYGSIIEYLDKMNAAGADAMALPWTWHDPQRATVWKDEPVNARFPAYRPDHFRHIKSIFRVNRFINSQCHFPFDDALNPRSYRSSDGGPAPAGPFSVKEFAEDVWVAHHLFKSLEELLVRRCRNRGDSAKRDVSGDTIFTDFLRPYLGEPRPFTEGPLSQLSFDADMTAKIDAEKRSLLAMEAVRAADAACKAWFKPESARVRAKLRQEARFQVPGSVEARVLDLLDQTIYEAADPMSPSVQHQA